jgi:hypothetical protein
MVMTVAGAVAEGWELLLRRSPQERIKVVCIIKLYKGFSLFFEILGY